jgi:type IV secretion system protein VirB9
MTEQPKTMDGADRVVIPFLPALRKKLGERLSPPASKLVVTDSGAKSRFWRGVGAVWHRLVVFSVVGAVAVTLAPHPAIASETPVPGPKDARVRNVNYDPDQVVTIVGSFRHAIEIQFGPNETVTQAALGDTISWQIAPVGNIVFLKPREKAGGTNLIVVTNVNGAPRTYHFNLTRRRRGNVWHPVPLPARGASYGDASDPARRGTGRARGRKQHHHSRARSCRDRRNAKHELHGAGRPSLQPTEISDNGEFTVLRYPGHADIPSIFAVDVDGTETIVPYDVREDFVVIHAVYRQLRLRRGNVVLCIYNEAPPRNDRGDRTGTVSNIVERKVKGQ